MAQSRRLSSLNTNRLSLFLRFFVRCLVCFGFCLPVSGLRPLRERARSWGEEWLPIRKDENELGPFSAWNITGTYRGSWRFTDSMNTSSRFPDFRKSMGNSVFELASTPTKITGVHYVQGLIIFHDVYDNEHEFGGARIKVEGVYIWPFRQLRLVANRSRHNFKKTNFSISKHKCGHCEIVRLSKLLITLGFRTTIYLQRMSISLGMNFVKISEKYSTDMSCRTIPLS